MNTKNENNLLKKHTTPIYDITTFTTLDYPNHLAAVIWFPGCNMRCRYCYNADIVLGKGKITVAHLLDFLKTRQGLQDAVVLSGGEPTGYRDIHALCQTIQAMGFKIKLDTNGIRFHTIQKLVTERLIDYIALDYKAPKEAFENITQSRRFEPFSQTLSFLINQNFPFEVRTTVHNDLLTPKEINQIIDDLYHKGYQGNYYLQPFFFTDMTLGDLPKEKKMFNRTQLSKKLNVIWR